MVTAISQARKAPVGIGKRVDLVEAKVKAAHDALLRIEALVEHLALSLGLTPKAIRDIRGETQH